MKRILIITVMMLAVSIGFAQHGASRSAQPSRTAPSASYSSRGSASVSRQSSPGTAAYRTPTPSPSRTNTQYQQASRTPSYRQPSQTSTYRPSNTTATAPRTTAPSSYRTTATPARVQQSVTTSSARQAASKADYTRRPSAAPASDNTSRMPSHYAIPDNTSRRAAGPQDKGYGGPHHPGGPNEMHPHHTYGHMHHVPHGMHPRPPMYHPIHHRPIYLTYRVYNDWIWHHIIWMNYWSYLHTVTYYEPAVIIAHVNTTTPANTLIDYAVAENMVFSLYRDNMSGKTYFAITDDSDNTLARVEVGRKYTRVELDENGVWLLSKNSKSAVYFMFIDGQLYMYDND